MKIDYEGPYDRTRERRGLAREKRAYIAVLKIVAIAIILLIGIVTLNRLDTIMYQQAHIIKTQADAMDQLMWIRQDIMVLEEQLQMLKDEAETLKSKPVSLGEFTITHYCLEDYPHICNDGDPTHTASRRSPIPYYAISADPSIPFGTKLVIDGQEYEVMDRGGDIVGRRLDLCVPTHTEAIARGKITREVYIK